MHSCIGVCALFVTELNVLRIELVIPKLYVYAGKVSNKYTSNRFPETTKYRRCTDRDCLKPGFKQTHAAVRMIGIKDGGKDFLILLKQ